MRQRHVHPAGRALVLAGSLLLALALAVTAVLWPGAPDPDGASLQAALSGIVLEEDTLTPASPVSPDRTEETGDGDEAGLVVRDRDGFVCVYRGDTVYCMTGIPVLSLPARDRAALAEGIPVEDEAEMHQVLEDFGS